MAAYDFTGINGLAISEPGLTALPTASSWTYFSNSAKYSGGVPGYLLDLSAGRDLTLSTTIGLGSSLTLSGLIFRYSDSNNFLFAGISTSGQGALNLYSFVNGSASVLGSYNLGSILFGQPYLLEVSAVGTDISVQLNGVERINATYSVHLNNNGAGLRSNSGSDRFEYLYITDLSPADTVPPVINLIGSVSVTVTQGDTYTDAGATASDDVDGDITANIVTANPVDTSTVGTYTVTYNVSDAAGNAATEVTRTVIVEEEAVDPPTPDPFTGAYNDCRYGWFKRAVARLGVFRSSDGLLIQSSDGKILGVR